MDETRVSIAYDGIKAVAGGIATGVRPSRLEKVLAKNEFSIDIDLGLGRGEAYLLACDCTEEYVGINKV